MSHEGPRQEPRVAYYEEAEEDDEDEDEYEDEVATPLANVAVKRAEAASVTKRASYERRRNDGSDSGYSSKTGTNTSTSSSRMDMAELKIDTSRMERQPQPYAFIQRPAPKQKYHVHKKGEGCWVCDTWGEHLPDNLRPRKEAIVPPSPKATKETRERPTKRDDAAPRPVRRDSSVRASRPVSAYVPGAAQFNYPPAQAPYVVQYAFPPMSPAAWPAPFTPSTPYSPAYPHNPPSMTTTYNADASYFEKAPLREDRPSRSDRRSSMYGDAILRQSKAETRPIEPQRTSSLRDHARSNSDRTNRAEESDRSMPPPPRPTVTLARRPSIKKSATYNTLVTSNTNRRSQVIDDDAIYVSNTTAPSPSKERRVEPSLPPSSYRGPMEVSESRPARLNRKSVSYSTPMGTTKTSSSIVPSVSAPNPRRSTTTGTPAEARKIVDAETYQARSSMTSSDLTAEALLKLKKRHPSSRSETGSHKSHHTKSSSSGGGKAKQSSSEIKMIINGVNLSIPTSAAEQQDVSISTRKNGGVSISLNNRGDRDEDRLHAGFQKRIEKAPSATSRGSHVSSKSIGSKEREYERDEREWELEQYTGFRRLSDANRSRSRTGGVRRSYDYDGGNPWEE